MLIDPEQVGEFFHSGENGDFFGDHRVYALPLEEGLDPFLYGSPVAIKVVGDVALLAPEVVDDGGRLGAQFEIEAVAKAMGGVGAEDDGAVAKAGATQGGGGGDASLADAAFAGVKEDAQGGLSPAEVHPDVTGCGQTLGGRGRTGRPGT